MTSTQKGGGGVLKFVTCLWILLFLNNRSIVHFYGCWGGGEVGVKKLVIFCGRHKSMTPNKILLSKSNKLSNIDLKCVEIFNTLFNCIVHKLEVLINDSLLEDVSVTEDPILAAVQKYKRRPILHKRKEDLRKK